MPQDYDELFAQFALEIKALDTKQVTDCLSNCRKHEDAGRARLFAVVAVDLGYLQSKHAARIIEMINRKYPGKHPPLASAPAPTVKLAPPPAPPPEKLAPSPPPPPPLIDYPTPPTMIAHPKPAPEKPQPEAAPPKKAPLARPPAPAKRPRPVVVAKKPMRKVMIAGAIGAVIAILVIVLVVAIVLSGGRRDKPSVSEGDPAPMPVETARAPILKPDPPPPPAEAKGPAATETEKDLFHRRFREKQKKALDRLEEAKRLLAEERQAAAAAEEALRKRLAGKPLDLALRSGQSHARAVIRSYTLSDCEIESGGGTVSLPWDSLSRESLFAAADALFDTASAAAQFDRGRFLIARQLWKEARESFDRAVKLDDALDSKVSKVRESLEQLLTGQAGFQGAARRIGADGLLLRYDFKRSEELQDFTGGLTVASGAAVLEAKAKHRVLLHAGSSDGLEFVVDLDIVMKATSDAPITFGFFQEGRRGVEIEVGPEGAAAYRLNPEAKSETDRRVPLAKGAAVKFELGKPQEIQIAAHDRKFKVLIDGREALSAEDPPVAGQKGELRGAFSFGIEKGRLAIAAPFTVQGRTHPRELEKRFSEIETLARRAVDPDLEDVELLRGRDIGRRIMGTPGSDLKLTADDAYFVFRIKTNQDLAAYDETKQKVVDFIDRGAEKEEVKKELDRLIGLYADVPSLFYLRALYHSRMQELAAARADIQKAVVLFPEFAEAHALAARVRDLSEDDQAAIAALNRAIEAMPDYAPAYVARAREALTRGTSTPEQCSVDLRLAQKLDPENREVPTFLRTLKYASRGPKDLGCRFEHESEHYKVVTDISAEAAKLYADRLEAAFAHYVVTFKHVYALKPMRKPRVAIFNTAENYYTYFELLSEDRGEYTLGAFRQGLNELVLFETRDLEETFHTLYHEAFHHFTTLLTDAHPPYWYNEGIAEYMGAITVENGKVVQKARILKGRLGNLQVALTAEYVLPFSKIMCETPQEFYSGAVGLKYAQAWSMIHFFYEFENGKHRPLIEKYFESIRGRKPAREAFEDVFGPKAGELEKEWKQFVRGLKP